ncbi:histidine phosphatase family protein [Paenibacillus donghaensis]|uniref:Histidine phosphatase family protein n=1 Tax=Paenibacillus donghaensis TaxID=414771 RepID=A0A2Z2KLG6_9BACL|nr:histidine phosphatase family protein [Paenibacillus donghaensis]ASA20811.1 histidine phosphatase family protein [Paenibacillus donghaensis]
MITSLYMVRHAASPFVVGEELKRGLSEQGLKDARVISDILMNEEIALLISSPYKRAIDTISFLAEALNQEIHRYEELRERAIVSTEIEIAHEEILRGIERSFSDVNYKMQGGESTLEAQKRVIPLIEKIINQYKGKKVAVGTHGNIMTIILNYFDQEYGYAFFAQTSKPDIYKLELDDLKLLRVERLWPASCEAAPRGI